MTDTRRVGDKRPFKHDPDQTLTLIPVHGEPFRWLPRHGDPSCVLEWLSQKLIKVIAFLPVYVAIVVTMSLLLQIFGVPFVGGR